MTDCTAHSGMFKYYFYFAFFDMLHLEGKSYLVLKNVNLR